MMAHVKEWGKTNKREMYWSDKILNKTVGITKGKPARGHTGTAKQKGGK
jgi:hypothetical protein